MKLGRRVTKQTPTTIGGGKKRINKLDLIYKARKMGGQRNVDVKEFCSWKKFNETSITHSPTQHGVCRNGEW